MVVSDQKSKHGQQRKIAEDALLEIKNIWRAFNHTKVIEIAKIQTKSIIPFPFDC